MSATYREPIWTVLLFAMIVQSILSRQENNSIFGLRYPAQRGSKEAPYLSEGQATSAAELQFAILGSSSLVKNQPCSIPQRK